MFEVVWWRYESIRVEAVSRQIGSQNQEGLRDISKTRENWYGQERVWEWVIETTAGQRFYCAPYICGEFDTFDRATKLKDHGEFVKW